MSYLKNILARIYILAGRHEIYKSKWFAYESLQFLEDKDEPRRTLSVSILIEKNRKLG